MLELILEKCIASGFHDFYFSVNYLKDQIIDYFKMVRVGCINPLPRRSISFGYCRFLCPLNTLKSLFWSLVATS